MVRGADPAANKSHDSLQEEQSKCLTRSDNVQFCLLPSVLGASQNYFFFTTVPRTLVL
jgi:hypothetical protein